MTDLVQPYLHAYKESTGQEEGGIEEQKGEPVIDTVRTRELAGGLDNPLGRPGEKGEQRDIEGEGISMGIGGKGNLLSLEGKEEMMDLELVNMSVSGERSCFRELNQNVMVNSCIGWENLRREKRILEEDS